MRSLFLASSLLTPVVCLSAPAFAQDAPVVPSDEDEGTDNSPEIVGNEIIVHGTRMRGQVDAPQPPIMTLNEEDIQSYGVSSLDELITALSPQTGSGRGRGDGRPVMLINGRRISNFREFRNIPPEAIRRMEILPEEVALRFGYAANQRVINFILKDNFASRTVSAEYDRPTRGGFADSELEGTMLRISGDSRLNLNVQSKDTSMLTEAERNVIQQPGTTPTVAGDPDPAEFRSLVADSRDLTLTGSWSTGLGKSGSSLSLNAQIGRSDSRSLSGLDSVLLTAPNGATALRTFEDALTRTTRTVSAQGGAALNTNLGAWQLSATIDADQDKTETRIDQRRQTAALVAAAAAGTLAIDGPLPSIGAQGFEVARSRSRSLDALITVSGTPFRMPAGEASLTFKTGFDYTGIRSTDTRTAGGGAIALNRGDLSAGLNLALPIASRGDNVLKGIGDLSLNLSAGANRLSDFGTLKDWSAGFTWSPFEKLSLQTSYLVNEAAPALTDLGNPVVQNLNVPVYDFTRGETVLVTTTTGGNPDLVREKQRDWKFGANWELPFFKNSNLIVEYFRNRSTDVTATFPVLTPEIEAAFPGRVVRDASGRLVSIDRRPVTFAETTGSRLRYGFNISGTIGKPQAGGGQRGPGMMGMGRPPGGPGGGGPRGGGGGMRGGGPMGMMGGGNGQGRWNLSLFHTWRFSEKALIAPGGPALDLLNGDALTGGGVARHALELEGGTFYKGFGLRFNGTWSAPTNLRSTTGGSDLRFGSVFDLDLRAFVNFDQQKSLVEAVPFLKGARLSFKIENLLDSRQKVTDNTGAVPISYQADFMDPRGRVIGIDFRKMF